MRKLFFGVSVLLWLSSCAGDPLLRGHIIRGYQLDQLESGENLTKTEVDSEIGSPSFQSVDGRRWYYVSYESTPARIFPEQIEEVRLVLLEFDDSDILVEISQESKAGWDGSEELEMATDVTADPDGDVNWFKELFGRLGTIDFRNR